MLNVEWSASIQHSAFNILMTGNLFGDEEFAPWILGPTF